MKSLGVIGIVSGGLLILVGSACLVSYGTIAIVPLLIGLIAILCGAICMAMDRIFQRLEELDEKLSKIQSKGPSAEHVVDQLRQEGLIGPGSTASEEEIHELIE